MKNLGKIILFITIISSSLFAITAKISPKVIYQGDKASLIISAKGKDIKFPKLKQIAGYRVESQAISRNITNLNGKVTKTLSKEYIFTPQKDFLLPKIDIEVDGKTESTKPMRVEVRTDKIGKKDAFIFTLTLDKKEAYVGEPVNVTFTFKKHLDTKLAEANFNSPTFHDFWAKPLKKQPALIEGDYQVYRIKYLLFPQKSGKLIIEPGRMDVGILQKRKRDHFSFERVKWKSFFTKEASIEIKPLPTGVDIYGDYKMSVTVDKQKTKTNEPVNLTIEIRGIGNVDDIEEFKLDIKDAIVYADKPEKKIYTNNKEELGEFTQKFAIVSDRNFTIPPIKFTFLSSKDHKIEKLKSKEYKIEVIGNIIKTSTAKLEKKENKSNTEQKVKIIYDKVSKTKLFLVGIGGFLLGLASMLLYHRSSKRQKSEKTEPSLSKKIKKSKNEKDLLSLLIPYSDRSSKMKDIIKSLEENVYEKKNNKINKSDLVKNIEDYLKKDKDIEEILKQ